MERKDLTWDKIKELADKAIECDKDFSLNIGSDGYIDIEIKTPTKTVSQSQTKFVSNTKSSKSWPTPIPWKWGYS